MRLTSKPLIGKVRCRCRSSLMEFVLSAEESVGLAALLVASLAASAIHVLGNKSARTAAKLAAAPKVREGKSLNLMLDAFTVAKLECQLRLSDGGGKSVVPNMLK